MKFRKGMKVRIIKIKKAETSGDSYFCQYPKEQAEKKCLDCDIFLEREVIIRDISLDGYLYFEKINGGGYCSESGFDSSVFRLSYEWEDL